MTVGPVRRDEASNEFFEGTARGEFLLRRCPEGHSSEPAAEQCTTCGTTELAHVAAAGGARVVSWSVTHGRPTPEQPDPRTLLVIAEFDEGPWWWSQIVAADPESVQSIQDSVQVGSRLQVAFQRYDDESEAVPVFTLV